MNETSTQKSSWSSTVFHGWLVLQITSGLALVAVWFLLRLVVEWFFPGGDEFRTSWLAAFVVVPVGFLPVLVWWQGWAGRRFGRQPRTFRLVTEVAFALDVVGCLLLRGIA